VESILLTVEEAAKTLKVGRTRFYQMMREEPELRPVHIGRAVRLSRANVQAWVERQVRENGTRE
jgi:excisionase family DNA binding protein